MATLSLITSCDGWGGGASWGDKQINKAIRSPCVTAGHREGSVGAGEGDVKRAAQTECGAALANHNRGAERCNHLGETLSRQSFISPIVAANWKA